MNKCKGLLAAIVAVLCVAGCDAQPVEQPRSTSGSVEFIGACQAELSSGQNLSLVTVRSMRNFYRPELLGPFQEETVRTFSFDGNHLILTRWSSDISYHVTTGEIVSIRNGVYPTRYDLNIAKVGDTDFADEGKITVKRIRQDAVSVSWSTPDTRVF